MGVGWGRLMEEPAFSQHWFAALLAAVLSHSVILINSPAAPENHGELSVLRAKSCFLPRLPLQAPPTFFRVSAHALKGAFKVELFLLNLLWFLSLTFDPPHASFHEGVTHGCTLTA